MQKPNNYDETKVSGDFTPVNVGGHYAIVKQVSEVKSKTGKDMIVVLFDFDKADAQSGYFMKAFTEDVREQKKWPFQGSKYIMVNDYMEQNKTSKNFKSFCRAVEESNEGFTVSWGNDWGKQFSGKKIGVVYGLEENEYDGKTFMRPAVKWFCRYSEALSSKVPEPKYLKKEAAAAPAYAPAVDDSDLPF